MASRNGIPISENKGFQKQGSWIPVTPVKKIHWITTGERGGSDSSTSGQLDHAVVANRVGDLGNQGAVLAAQTEIYSPGSHTQAFRNAEARYGSHGSLMHLLACTDGTSAATAMQEGTSNFSTIRHAQSSNGRIHQQQNSTSLLLQMNQNLLLEMSPDGFPVRYFNCDINSSQRIMDIASNGNMPFHFDSVTPERGEKGGLQNSQPTVTVNLNKTVDLNKEANREDENDSPSIELCNNQVHLRRIDSTPVVLHRTVPQSMDSPPATLSTPAKEKEKRDDNEMDLNKTPQPKPRRKKHRPKVIKEGKTRRTPKPVTPKQATGKENPSGKRKYVWRTGPKAPVTPLADGESLNPARETGTRSCRRSLNFDSEGKAEDKCPNMTPLQQDRQSGNFVDDANTGSCTWYPEVQSQTRDCTYFNLNSGSKSTIQLAQGLDVVVEKNPVRLDFDLNCCSTQMLEDYISIPKNLDLSPVTKEKIKELARNKIIEASACINEDISSDPMPGGDSNCNPMPQYPHVEEIDCIAKRSLDSNTEARSGESIQARKGTKREYRVTSDDSHLFSMNLMENHNMSYGSINNGNLHFPDIYKKKRTAISSMTAIDNSCTRAANRGKLFMLHTVEEKRQVGSGNSNTVCKLAGENIHIHQNISEESLLSLESQIEQFKCNRQQMLDNVLGLQIERMVKKKRSGSFQVRPRLAIVNNDKQLQVHPKIQVHCPQPCVEALVADNNPKMKTKKRMKRERTSHSRNSKSYSNMSLLHQQLGTSVNGVRSLQEAYTMGLWSQESVAYKDPVEEIIHKLTHLNINGENKVNAAGALVLYGGDRTMVPYLFFDPAKKRRPRAKVDLDPETNRVWKLLMWKEGNDGTEGKDEEKEKWWEEQRRVFRGRVDSFIARMHLVQGDRRFSQWKGSVVDSVVGVFLTQNVSDHLSSSAYMALAARFPLRSQNNNKGPDLEETSTSAEENEVCILESDESIKWDNNRSDQGSVTIHEAEPIQKKIEKLNESFGSTMGCRTASLKEKNVTTSESGQEMRRESPENYTGTSATLSGSASLEDAEYMKGLEDVVSSQSSVVSSQNSAESTIHTADRIMSSSESKLEADCLIDYPFFSSFTELLQSQMIGSEKLQELTHEDSNIPFKENFKDAHNQSEGMGFENKNSSFKGVVGLNGSCSSIYASNAHYPQTLHGFQEIPSSFSDYQLHSSPGSSGIVELESVEASGEESRCLLPPNTAESTELNDIYSTRKRMGLGENVSKFMVQQNPLSSDQTVRESDSCAHLENHPVSCSYNNIPRERTGASSSNGIFHTCSKSIVGQTVDFLQKQREGDLEVEIIEGAKNFEELTQRQNSRTQHTHSNLPKHLGDTLDVAESSSLKDKQQLVERKEAESNSREEVAGSKHLSTETTNNSSKVKKASGPAEKKVFDWDSLRKQACCNGPKKERSSDRIDSLDWEAVRCAEVHEISNTIRERGMNNMLAERIKDFLNRIVRDHGSIDLEWLRDVPPDKAKEYLLSIRGLGLKSVECVRLLTLHHLAFPVDTNVGRICVRLGWVPLQPLPESLQLHLLELYPVQATIQKYLWPRLCTLDQRTLYELHYQMITFGKVFCTKSKPNCNACPMRAECRHFASAFASARLALPGPEEKSIVSSSIPMTTEEHHKLVINPLPLPPMEGHPHPQAGSGIKVCEPIVEEPATPEHECAEASQQEIQASDKDIEDAFWSEDPDEIPTIKLNIEEFTTNVQNYMQQNNMELQDCEMSKALVALTPEAASIPMPKLKNVSRLRTEHQVYELPDSHPLLVGLDRREPDDPCSYLLAIWTPGETAKSTQPPEICCNSEESGNLCDKETCFTCNSVREATAQTVRGTLLIPCRTAMRGSFPLNGTYFQVNEVFADHDSSLNPINVPRALIWNLPRRTVYFGTSMPSIFRGLTTQGIQHCFWRGFVCVRGFDQKTRAPRPLLARLHFPASKLVRSRKAPADLKE